MRAEQWHKASDELSKAAEAMPDATEYRLYSAWASYRLCAIDEERSVMRHELSELAHAMTKQDRHHGFPPYVLGHLALAAEDLSRALKLFKMASEHDRKNRDAERHVRLLTSRLRSSGKKKWGKAGKT